MIKKIIWIFIVLCLVGVSLVVYQAFGEHKTFDKKTTKVIVYHKYEKHPSKPLKKVPPIELFKKQIKVYLLDFLHNPSV